MATKYESLRSIKERIKSATKTNNKRRAQLYLKHKGKCFYCGKDTIFEDLRDGNPDLATIEHLYPKHDLRGFLIRKSYYDHTVLSCYACNQKRNEEFNPQSNRPRWEPYIIGMLLSNQKSELQRIPFELAV